MTSNRSQTSHGKNIRPPELEPLLSEHDVARITGMSVRPCGDGDCFGKDQSTSRSARRSVTNQKIYRGGWKPDRPEETTTARRRHPRDERMADDTHLRRPMIGEPFNPYKRFNNVLIPEAMARSREIAPAAKLVYGRLRRYAGNDGLCYPRGDTPGEEVGLGERQTQKHLRTLEANGLLRTELRFDRHGGQTSNGYVFLWHRSFDEWEQKQQGARRG